MLMNPGEHVVTCARCRVTQDGLYGDHVKLLNVLGWHQIGTSWFCSRHCLEWAQATAKASEPQPVTALQDRAYHAQRAKLAKRS